MRHFDGKDMYGAFVWFQSARSNLTGRILWVIIRDDGFIADEELFDINVYMKMFAQEFTR